MIDNYQNATSCNRSPHLFRHPVCKNQTLLKKIGTIFFHIFTFGIPLAFYHIFKCCFSRKATTNPGHGDLQERGLKAIQASQQALEFADKKLEEFPDIVPTRFKTLTGGAKTYQPTNQKIAKLLTILWDHVFEDFEKALKNNRENSWENPQVLDAADAYMKISYAISVLTLEDLKPFTEKLSTDEGITRTYAEALTEQDSFMYRTSYTCTKAYHSIRKGVTWGVNPFTHAEGLRPPKSIPDSHAKPFYKEKTLPNSWNILYSDYCLLLRKAVPEKELAKADDRILRWTIKDTGVKTFEAVPCIPPT